MKIAVAQIKCLLGDVSANIDQIASPPQKMAKKGGHVIVFPEMVDTGYEIGRKLLPGTKRRFNRFISSIRIMAFMLYMVSMKKKGNKTITELNDAMANSKEAFTYQSM